MRARALVATTSKKCFGGKMASKQSGHGKSDETISAAEKLAEARETLKSKLGSFHGIKYHNTVQL